MLMSILDEHPGLRPSLFVSGAVLTSFSYQVLIQRSHNNSENPSLRQRLGNAVFLLFFICMHAASFTAAGASVVGFEGGMAVAALGVMPVSLIWTAADFHRPLPLRHQAIIPWACLALSVALPFVSTIANLADDAYLEVPACMSIGMIMVGMAHVLKISTHEFQAQLNNT